MPALAFFDIDRTLTSFNVGWEWVVHEAGAGRISPWIAVRYMGWLGGHALGVIVSEQVMVRAISTLRGESEAALRARTRRFCEVRLMGRYRPGAIEALADHRARGDVLVLLTSASQYLADWVSEDLRMDGAVGCTYEADARGVLTGRPEGRLCVGEGKRHYAQQTADAHGVSLSECHFYSDSIADLPALEAVGTPVPVNPDRKLSAVARERGWRIEEWGTPT